MSGSFLFAGDPLSSPFFSQEKRRVRRGLFADRLS